MFPDTLQVHNQWPFTPKFAYRPDQFLAFIVAIEGVKRDDPFASLPTLTRWPAATPAIIAADSALVHSAIHQSCIWMSSDEVQKVTNLLK